MAKRICSLVMALLLLTQVVFADQTDELSLVLNSHKNAKPYTMDYIRRTDELFDKVSAYAKSDNEEYKKLAENTQSYLDSAIARVDFMMESAIKRLGNDLTITTENVEYVNQTLVDIANVYAMPAFKSQSPCNDSAYTALNNRVSRLQKFKKEIVSANGVLNSLNGTKNLDDALLTYQKLKAERDLLDSHRIYALSKALDITGRTVVTLPKEVLRADGLNLFGKDGVPEEKIHLKYTEIKNQLPVKVSKQMLTGYQVKTAFKLTVNDVGGKIPSTTFVMPISDSKGQQFLIHSDGRIFEDTYADPKTFSFTTDTLGDYYLIENVDYYTYSTEFESRMEWQYQNAIMAKLIYMSENTGVNEVPLNVVGLRELPQVVLDTLANNNKAIVLKTHSDVANQPSEAVLLPAAFKAMERKDYYPVAALVSYAHVTQDKPEYRQTYIGDDDNDEDLVIDNKKRHVQNSAIVKAMAIAGLVLTLAALAVIIGNDGKRSSNDETK